MTNADWEAARETADKYLKISENKTSNEWFKLIDDYYIKLLEKRIKSEEKVMNDMAKAAID